MSVFFTRRGAVPVFDTHLSDFAVGEIVYLNENNQPIPYIIVNQGIPSNSNLYDSSCDGTWLLRKNLYFDSIVWHSSFNNYKNSNIHSHLNGTFLKLFDSVTQNAIKQVKLPYINGSGGSNSSVSSGSNGISAKIFPLSGFEVGGTSSTFYLVDDDKAGALVDGAKLEYFLSGTTSEANNRRMAYTEGGTTEAYHLRTIVSTGSNRIWSVMSYGGITDYAVQASWKVRPALVLPSTSIFDPETRLFIGVA